MTTTSFFFNNFSSASEQRLLNDLSVEMIRIHGIEAYYMNRTHVNIDYLFMSDPLSKFEHAIPLEMYIKNFSSYQGEGDMLSKFGITMADQITLSVSRTRFTEDIGSIYDLIRPNEGDLIYIPMTKSLFEVKFVEHESNFYQTGSLQYYDLKCERFNYNSERLDTGVSEIDAIETKYSAVQANGTYSADPLAQNDYFENTALTFVDFSVTNPFSENVV